MRSLSTTHAHLSEHQLALHKDAFDGLRARLDDARDDFSYKSAHSFLSYITDEKLQKELEALRDEKGANTIKKIFVVGIGGANLGAKAIIEAFPKGLIKPAFVFLDTLYSGEADEVMSHTADLGELNDFLIIVASKSGKTLETLAGAQLLITTLEQRFGTVASRLVVITSLASPLHTWAKGGGISIVTVPHDLSDRYSVFSPIGVVPLMFAGISIADFFAGANEALSSNIGATIGPAFQAACALDVNVPDGVHAILDLFFFSEHLETLGKWGRQLIAESLGKERTTTGAPLNKSLTPTVSIGTTDLHSMLQLYLAQPKERITWFTTLSRDGKKGIGIPNELKALLPGIDKTNPEHLLEVIYTEIASIYRDRDIPYLHSALDDITSLDLGYFMMTTMLVTLGLAELWDVDPFDQPNVEEYKERVRETLGNEA